MKLLSQRDYLLQSVLITTKCFQLLYTELKLENQNFARSLWFGWKKKYTHTHIHINAFSKLNCHLPLFSLIRKYKKVVFLSNKKQDPRICKNIIHENVLEFRGDFKKQIHSLENDSICRWLLWLKINNLKNRMANWATIYRIDIISCLLCPLLRFCINHKNPHIFIYYSTNS